MNRTCMFDALAKVDEKYVDNCLESLSEGAAKQVTPSHKNVLRPVLIGSIVTLVVIAVVLGLVFGLPALKGDTGEHMEPDKISATEGPEENDNEDKLIELENITLKRTDGQWYMTLNDESSVLGDSNLLVKPIRFDSVEEIVAKIRTGDFSKAELRYMYETFRRDENGFIVFDIDDPPLPVFPELYSMSSVIWAGEAYTVVVTDGEGNTVQIAFGSGLADFEFDPDSYFEELDENDGLNYLDPELIDGKTVRYGSNKDGAVIRKFVISECYPGVFLVEIYSKSPSDASFRVVPNHIRMFQTAAEIKCVINISRPAKLFEPDELLEFGFVRKAKNEMIEQS